MPAAQSAPPAGAILAAPRYAAPAEILPGMPAFPFLDQTVSESWRPVMPAVLRALPQQDSRPREPSQMAGQPFPPRFVPVATAARASMRRRAVS
jgi:hypothetical protein